MPPLARRLVPRSKERVAYRRLVVTIYNNRDLSIQLGERFYSGKTVMIPFGP
jgi:hypothetical protein